MVELNYQDFDLQIIARIEVINNKTKAEKIINSNSVSGKFADWAINAHERNKIKRLMPAERIIF